MFFCSKYLSMDSSEAIEEIYIETLMIGLKKMDHVGINDKLLNQINDKW